MQQRANKNYLLNLLMVLFACNFLDRLALGIVLNDIKLDFDLSDAQLGLLSGLAFAVFYSLMGIPIARWADRGNRVLIISLTAALWSVAVMLCGVAASFVQLLIIRVGVAVGEAGCVPPAHSLIADYFSREERPKAVGRYLMGASLAVTIGYFAAGWLNELYGWRTTFVVLGAPGVALAALAWFTLLEPRQSKHVAEPAIALPAGEATVPLDELTYRQVLVTLWANLTFRHLVFCFSVWFFFGYGLLQWMPAFFLRSHGMQTGELGTWMAVVHGLAGAAGTYVGGALAVRYAAGNERLQLVACAICFAFFPVLMGATFLASDRHLAFAILTVTIFGSSLVQGPIFATIQTLVPARMRAMAIALVYLFANLIGMGLGPVSAGVLSDVLRPWFGEESLRYALVMLCPGYIWAGWHIWRASRTVVGDLSAMQLDSETRTVALNRLIYRPVQGR